MFTSQDGKRKETSNKIASKQIDNEFFKQAVVKGLLSKDAIPNNKEHANLAQQLNPSVSGVPQATLMLADGVINGIRDYAADSEITRNRIADAVQKKLLQSANLPVMPDTQISTPNNSPLVQPTINAASNSSQNSKSQTENQYFNRQIPQRNCDSRRDSKGLLGLSHNKVDQSGLVDNLLALNNNLELFENPIGLGQPGINVKWPIALAQNGLSPYPKMRQFSGKYQNKQISNNQNKDKNSSTVRLNAPAQPQNGISSRLTKREQGDYFTNKIYSLPIMKQYNKLVEELNRPSSQPVLSSRKGPIKPVWNSCLKDDIVDFMYDNIDHAQLGPNLPLSAQLSYSVILDKAKTKYENKFPNEMDFKSAVKLWYRNYPHLSQAEEDLNNLVIAQLISVATTGRPDIIPFITFLIKKIDGSKRVRKMTSDVENISTAATPFKKIPQLPRYLGGAVGASHVTGWDMSK